MGDVIKFPTRSDFLKRFPADLPQETAKALASAWDNTMALVKSGEGLSVSPETHRYLVQLLGRVLELESELALAKIGK